MHASLTQENIICVFIFVGEVHKYVNGSHFGYLLLPWQLMSTLDPYYIFYDLKMHDKVILMYIRYLLKVSCNQRYLGECSLANVNQVDLKDTPCQICRFLSAL